MNRNINIFHPTLILSNYTGTAATLVLYLYTILSTHLSLISTSFYIIYTILQ